MLWLQRHAWWGLLVLAVISTVRGLIDLASGVTWQAEDVTGKPIAQIAAESRFQRSARVPVPRSRREPRDGTGEEGRVCKVSGAARR
jgi:hypothetical protein